MIADFAIFAVLLVLGYGFGQYYEQRHYKSITKREKTLTELPAVATRLPPGQSLPGPSSIGKASIGEASPGKASHSPLYKQALVMGSVVIASDYFKSFVASLVNIFGGRIRSFEPLLDRGRREAMLRLKEQAQKNGASMVFNVKYETSRIGGRVPTIEVLAYGTALTPVGETTELSSLPDQPAISNNTSPGTTKPGTAGQFGSSAPDR